MITATIPSIIAYQVASRKVKRDFYNKALQNRYYKVYVPLRALFIGIHISGAVKKYSFKERILKCLESIKHLKPKELMHRLSRNFVSDSSYQVERGDKFPMSDIVKIVKKTANGQIRFFLNELTRQTE